MKVEIQKEILHNRFDKHKIHECIESSSFRVYLENNIEDLKQKRESDEIKETSVFLEKKTGRRTTDVFDTLIDL